MKELIGKAGGQYIAVQNYICDDTDADKPVLGAVATGEANGTTCVNVDEGVEYIVLREIWKQYVAL